MKRILFACIVAGAVAGTAFAKIPTAAPMTDEQKSEKAAKDKSAADKAAEGLGKSQDKAVASYKKGKGGEAKAVPTAAKK